MEKHLVKQIAAARNEGPTPVEEALNMVKAVAAADDQEGLGRLMVTRGIEENDIVSKIKNGQVVTCVIPEHRLYDYLRAGSATSFRVNVIAKEGEKFPYPNTDIGQRGKIISIEVQGEGNIAVSIERPEGSDPSIGHAPFWQKLESLEKSSEQKNGRYPLN